MKALVTRTRFKGIGDPNAGPALLGEMQDALRIGLAKPWRCIELESQGIVGGWHEARIIDTSRISSPERNSNTLPRGLNRDQSKQ